MNQTEKRSSTTGNPPAPSLNQGVGARQDQPIPLSLGVGYLDVCTGNKLLSQNDPRIAELRAIGLSEPWLDVARDVGFAALIAVWQRLSDHADNQDNRRCLYVPCFSGWTRRQRNLTIASLASAGESAKEIRRHLTEHSGTKVSLTHIQRIISQSKKCAEPSP